MLIIKYPILKYRFQCFPVVFIHLWPSFNIWLSKCRVLLCWRPHENSRMIDLAQKMIFHTNWFPKIVLWNIYLIWLQLVRCLTLLSGSLSNTQSWSAYSGVPIQSSFIFGQMSTADYHKCWVLWHWKPREKSRVMELLQKRILHTKGFPKIAHWDIPHLDAAC